MATVQSDRSKAFSPQQSTAAESVTPTAGIFSEDEDAPIVKSCDMAPEVRRRTLELISNAAAQQPKLLEREMAHHVKRALDVEFGPKWHCIVGRHFAAHVTYDPGHYIYVQLNRRVFLVFKSGAIAAVDNVPHELA